MKQIKMMFVALGFVALVCAGASTASAQALDDTWFKVDMSFKGEAVDTDDSSISKLSIKTSGYLYIYDTGAAYETQIFSEVDEGVWNVTGGGTIPPEFITDDEIFMPIQSWVFITPDPTQLAASLSGKFKVKLNKDDSLKKATFSTQGATVLPLPFTPENDILFGKIKVKVKMIDVDDLPPEVPVI